jgi:hypothetical protein
MKYSAVLACGLLLGCSSPSVQPHEDGWEQKVRAAEERHRKAFLVNDTAALDTMLANDFIVNSPQNRIIEKAELLNMVRRGVLAISTFEQKIDAVRRFGDIVVVMGVDSVVYAPPATVAGQTHRRRFTDLWQLRDTTWTFVARQASLLPR